MLQTESSFSAKKAISSRPASFINDVFITGVFLYPRGRGFIYIYTANILMVTIPSMMRNSVKRNNAPRPLHTGMTRVHDCMDSHVQCHIHGSLAVDYHWTVSALP